MAAVPEKMRGWHCAGYSNGDPSVGISELTLKHDLPVPTPSEGQVLIKIHFAAVNPVDWKLLAGFYKDFWQIAFPFVPCFDVSGVVAAVGSGCSLKVGDHVAADIGVVESCTPGAGFGPGGALAEFCLCPEAQVSKLPDGVDLRAAAGLPLAGLTSYQGLFTGKGCSGTGEPLGDVKQGHKVLVLGGASGTGHLAVQMAKVQGAFVATTVSSSSRADGKSKVEWMKELGVDVVINYTEEDWAVVLKGQNFDLIYDCVGKPEDAEKAHSGVLREGGQFITIANFAVGGTKDGVTSKFLMVKSAAADLDHMVKWFADGKLSIHVDKVFPLAEAQQALSYSMGGKCCGKVVVAVAGES